VRNSATVRETQTTDFKQEAALLEHAEEVRVSLQSGGHASKSLRRDNDSDFGMKDVSAHGRHATPTKISQLIWKGNWTPLVPGLLVPGQA